MQTFSNYQTFSNNSNFFSWFKCSQTFNTFSNFLKLSDLNFSPWFKCSQTLHTFQQTLTLSTFVYLCLPLIWWRIYAQIMCLFVYFHQMVNQKEYFFLDENKSNRRINLRHKQCSYRLRTESEIIRVLATLKGFWATVRRPTVMLTACSNYPVAQS